MWINEWERTNGTEAVLMWRMAAIWKLMECNEGTECNYSNWMKGGMKAQSRAMNVMNREWLKQPVEGDHTKWKGTWARGEPLGAGEINLNEWKAGLRPD